MGTGNQFRSDLYELYGYVQNSSIAYSKELFIETLRDFFSQDSYFHYQRDEWGFPKIPDHTDLDPSAGLNDNVTTRLYIGEAYRYDSIYYPALLIRGGSSKYVPISMSRDKESVQWNVTKVIDGYGNESVISTPAYFVQAGAWEGQLTVEVWTRGPRSRDSLVDLISLMFVDTRHDDMKNSGIFIKGVDRGSPSESDDRNDKIFKQSINFDIRSEWRRHIPIESVVDAINFCVDFGNLSTATPEIALNLGINSNIQLLDALVDL